jgi:hypothetical protein
MNVLFVDSKYNVYYMNMIHISLVYNMFRII